jgi:hypothetical protein
MDGVQIILNNYVESQYFAFVSNCRNQDRSQVR